MMKAARRKLNKLWSRKTKQKKQRNKSHHHHHQQQQQQQCQYQYNHPMPDEYPLPPPPPPNYHYRYSSLQFQPSAPPLPPSCLEPGSHGGGIPIEYSYSFLHQFHETHQQQQEEITEATYTATSPVGAAYSDEPLSQQQSHAYYDGTLLYQKSPPPSPPPVHGLPSVMQKTQTISGGGMLFACIIKLGAHLFPCFFPCFHIREARRP